jgi:hypothetical protein
MIYNVTLQSLEQKKVCFCILQTQLNFKNEKRYLNRLHWAGPVEQWQPTAIVVTGNI